MGVMSDVGVKCTHGSVTQMPVKRLTGSDLNESLRCLSLVRFIVLWLAVGPVSGPREGAVLARSPLYPLLPGALVRLMVTKGALAFAEALLADG